MNNTSKVVFAVIFTAVVMGICTLWSDAVSPVVGTQLAIQNVNGGNEDWQAMNLFTQNKHWIKLILLAIWAGVMAVLFIPKKSINMSAPSCMLILLSLMLGTGCMRPYEKPEYKEIGSAQTAFVIPLEGDTKGQAKFDSAAYLEAHKVATKRIQIPHRWNQEGRIPADGSWINTVNIIVVDRSPITREFKGDDTGKTKGKDNAIWVESADSVGFSMGWTVTAYIKEEDASQFLYMYPSGSLAGVIDTEIRARIQQSSANVAASYKLDTLRDKKGEIVKAVQEDAIPFFAKRGITITTVGMFGGMTYENPKIQDAIDQTFISQQEKVNAKAFLDAQNDKNARIQSEASALAEAARLKAKGEADGIEFVNTALAKANNNPQLIQLRSIEVEMKRATTWNGILPETLVGDSGNVWMGVNPMKDKSEAPIKK